MSDVDDRDLQLYRCTECGKVSVSIGWLHGHIERHRGFFGIQWPWSVGDYDSLMEMTEVVRVREHDVLEERDPKLVRS